MKLVINAIVAAVLSIVGISSWLSAGEPKSVFLDLIDGTLNKTPLSQLSIDRVTDILGRPSAVDNKFPAALGPGLLYRDFGVSVWFRVDQSCCQTIAIFLSRSPKAPDFFPFRGNLSPAITGDWKVNRILDELAAFRPVYRSADEVRRETEARTKIKSTGSTFDEIEVLRESHSLTFSADPITKFVERINVYVTKK